MRLVRLALALALGAALPAPAAAQVSLPPLAPGEVLLQISGLGEVTTPADLALLDALIIGQGEDRPAAGRMARAKLDRAVAAVRAAGIPAGDVQTGDPTAQAMQIPPMLMIYAATHGQRNSGATVYVPLRITIRDIRRLEAVRRALTASETAHAIPEYYLASPTATLRQARAQAVRRARADAESQAALRNMRIVRIARVSDRNGTAGLTQIVNEAETFWRLFGRMWQMQSSRVETIIGVGVDFVLAPL